MLLLQRSDLRPGPLPLSTAILVLFGLLAESVGVGEAQAHPGGVRDTIRSDWTEVRAPIRPVEAGPLQAYRPAERDKIGVIAPLRSAVLRPRQVSDPGIPARRSLRHFGNALVGSTIGVAAGTGIGLLLLRGAAEAGLDEDRRDRTWRDRRNSDAGAMLFAAGLFALVAGGPIGAVEGAGLEKRRTDAYVVGGVGELALGGLGYGLARRLDANATGRLLGLGVGAAIGAAAGVTLVAGEQGASAKAFGILPPVERGAVTYRNGTWQVSPPAVRVYPSLGAGPSLSIRVPLVSMRL